MEVLGIDIGGSGIKAAVVETANGQLISERIRLETPQPATPDLIAHSVQEVIEKLDWKGLVGCSFPTVIVDGKCLTSGNISQKWLNVQVDTLFKNHCNNSFFVANDADLAALAEMKLGAGKDKTGKVITITIGTGIGTGVFYNGQLIPNFEFGRMFYKKNKLIEHYAGSGAKKEKKLNLKDWAIRFDFFLNHLARITTPDFFILGGGISKKYEEFSHYLTVKTPTVAAHFRNDAGIVGAALFAENENSKNT
ncbi:MAG: ROK family protein [Flavobacteriales bacterium]|nr:ROK family protein [Flavobacteriales bacterium]